MTVTLDWEIEIDPTVEAFKIGNGTDFKLRAHDGLRGFPEIRTGDVLRANTDGAFVGTDYLGMRSVFFEVLVKGTDEDDLENNLELLRAAVRPGQRDEYAVSYQKPGQAVRRFVGRCRGYQPAGEWREQAAYMSTVRIRFDCTDPRIYSDTENSLEAQLAAAQNGLTFNMTANISFGGVAESGTLAADNDGSYPAPWVATINGPVTTPRIENITSGETLEFEITLATGETLVVDSLFRTVLLGGTASRYSTLTAESEWFQLAPGQNSVRFAGASGTGTMDLSYRDAWA